MTRVWPDTVFVNLKHKLAATGGRGWIVELLVQCNFFHTDKVALKNNYLSMVHLLKLMIAAILIVTSVFPIISRSSQTYTWDNNWFLLREGQQKCCNAVEAFLFCTAPENWCGIAMVFRPLGLVWGYVCSHLSGIVQSWTVILVFVKRVRQICQILLKGVLFTPST